MLVVFRTTVEPVAENVKLDAVPVVLPNVQGVALDPSSVTVELSIVNTLVLLLLEDMAEQDTAKPPVLKVPLGNVMEFAPQFKASVSAQAPLTPLRTTAPTLLPAVVIVCPASVARNCS